MENDHRLPAWQGKLTYSLVKSLSKGSFSETLIHTYVTSTGVFEYKLYMSSPTSACQSFRVMCYQYNWFKQVLQMKHPPEWHINIFWSDFTMVKIWLGLGTNMPWVKLTTFIVVVLKITWLSLENNHIHA